MPFPIQYPLINGHRYSWASIEAGFNGLPILGIKSINYKDSLKGALVRGSKPQPIGRTRGQYEASFDFEMYRKEWEVFKLTLFGGIGFMEFPFPLFIQYSELPLEPLVVTDLLIGCRVEENDSSNQDGTDASTIKCTGSAMRIVWNGSIAAAPIGIGF